MKLDIFIEISKGGLVKYEFDKKAKQLRVDRFLHGAMYFPFNYGFIPGTIGEDKDPLDAVVLASKSVYPGCLMSCQVIGLLEMEDEEGIDTKILMVPDIKVDPLLGKIQNIDDLDDSTKEKVKNFFEHYKDLEKNKWVKLKNWRSRQEAEREINKGLERAAKG
ncbi:MAG TPA: inorganic diphosphatase [Candidatus Bathyarchaeia archaeon]|nr:inorganic diphosphatase [Candidatus Bathyarchaeia archaeon]